MFAGFERGCRNRKEPESYDPQSQKKSAVARRGLLAPVFALADVMTIVGCFVAIGVSYSKIGLRVDGTSWLFAEHGSLFAVIYVVVNACRREYSLQSYVFSRSSFERVTRSWSLTFMLVLMAAYFLQETAKLSRVTVLSVYVIGFLAIVALRSMVTACLKQHASNVQVLRIVTVGSAEELQAFELAHEPSMMGVHVVASAILRGAQSSTQSLAEDLGLAVELARVVQPDRIYMLSPCNADVEASIIWAFREVPAALHLGPRSLLTRFEGAAVQQRFGVTTLRLMRSPIAVGSDACKRLLDMVVSSVLTLVTAPALVLIAVGIKLESRGPIFEVDHLTGRNQRRFRAFRFRSTYLDAERSCGHAGGRGDKTHIGSALATIGFEKLPRLLNVIIGEMSMVGPRPLPVGNGDGGAGYVRRNCLKPGLTGWAQIHDLRRATVSSQALQAHIDYDLNYIDRRSLGFDLRILARSVFLSTAPDRRLAERNAAGLRRREASRSALLQQLSGLRQPASSTRDIFGIAVDDLSFEDAIALGQACLTGEMRRAIFIVNAHTLNLVSASQIFRRVVEQGHFVFGDGTGVRLAAAMQGSRLQANLNGTDFVPALLASTSGASRRCYLLGGKQAVVAKAAAQIERRYPGWTVVGYHHGFLDQMTSAVVIDQINMLKPNLLLVGMGNPHQEFWISENLEKISVNLTIGVGALFSYISGDYFRAPAMMRSLGIEWLWVLVTQPHKWRRYVVGNPAFLQRALLQSSKRLFRKPDAAC